MTDRDYMLRAIELAKKGEGWVNPNPLVGAVIVKDGRIIGEGWHKKYGELHAEREAFAALTESAEGADLYVTLEPCCHYGKQPPCTEAILENGIRRVVIGSRDPNPKVAGKGAAILRERGVLVEEDFLREECDRLNPVFFNYITRKRPFVRMKYAMTADGKIATRTGASRWIPGEAARRKVHEWRHALMGIMAGIGTVLLDDPMLDCRIENGKNPVRIICDTHLRIPEESRIVKTAGEIETIVACGIPFLPAGWLTGEILNTGSGEADESGMETAETEAAGADGIAAKAEALLEKGVKLINFPGNEKPGIPLAELMDALGERGIDSILLEGGGTLNESALRAGIVNEVCLFLAPKIFGGRARTPVEGEGAALPSEAMRLQYVSSEQTGEDFLITYRIPEDAVFGAREREEDTKQDIAE